MDDILILAYPQLYIPYIAAIGSAILMFLILYVTALMKRVRKANILQPLSLPLWLNFLYPSWLDKLILRQIMTAFAWSLGTAVISWMVLAVMLLALLVKVYGP